MGRTLFVADVHASPADPGRRDRFLRFLGENADIDRLYILGDLFDFLSGPWDVEAPDHRAVIEGLRGLTRRGVDVRFMPGNRDYFADRRLARLTGAEMIPERVELELGGKRVFLTHGDMLYNRNPKYGAYRRMMRFRPVLHTYYALSRVFGRCIAGSFRVVSVKTTPARPWSREDLLAGAAPLFDRGVDVVICGHVHVPFHLSRGGGELFVLGDWDRGGEYVEFDGRAFTLRKPS